MAIALAVAVVVVEWSASSCPFFTDDPSSNPTSRLIDLCVKKILVKPRYMSTKVLGNQGTCQPRNLSTEVFGNQGTCQPRYCTWKPRYVSTKKFFNKGTWKPRYVSTMVRVNQETCQPRYLETKVLSFSIGNTQSRQTIPLKEES